MKSQPLGLTLLQNCGAGACPAVFATDRESFVIRGDLLANGVVDLGPGEAAIEVPRAILIELAKKLRQE